MEPNNNNSVEGSPQLNGSSTPTPMTPTTDIEMTTLTLRMIMQGKEAGSIIGKKGDNVKRFREESGARINISDASCPERIVTVTGSTQQIVSAFNMISKRFEKDLQNSNPGGVTTAKQLITLHLIIPANQCGSLIGKGGAKIKEIRDVAGASIQISSEMLPNSTERTVTVSGSVDAISRAVRQICCVMLESPPKGATIPYRPKLAMTSVILAGGQAFAVHGQYFIPQPDPRAAHHQQQQQHHAQTALVQYQPVPQFTKMAALQQGMLTHSLSPYTTQQAILAPPYPAFGLGGFIRAPPQPGLISAQQQQPQTHEISIPNDLIGCIIGRGGSKINEIRQLSGANIKIAGAEEGVTSRVVTISGMPDSINAAQYLINASLELHKNLTLTLADHISNSSPPPPPNTLNLSSVNLDEMSTFSSATLTPTISTKTLNCESTNFASVPSSVTLAPVNSTQLSQMAFTFVNAVNMSAMVNNLNPPLPGGMNSSQLPSSFPFNPIVKPVSMLSYSEMVGGTYIDSRCGFATKIKGGLSLAATAKINNKFSPY